MEPLSAAVPSKQPKSVEVLLCQGSRWQMILCQALGHRPPQLQKLASLSVKEGI